MNNRSCYKAILCGLVACLSLVVTVPAQEANIVELKPAAGEIRLEGKIRALVASVFVLDAASFTLPSGKSGPLVPPKPKTVFITPQTVVQMRGDVKRSGQALSSRRILVWNAVQKGVYQWSGTEKTAVSETVDSADVPPDDEIGRLRRGPAQQL